VTNTQQALTEGFLANLEERGFTVELEGKGVSFEALLPPLAPDSAQFQVGDNEREGSRIRVLREHLPVPNPVIIGDYLLQVETNRRHRVGEIFDHPTDVGVTFICETVPMP
jgi:hypothetical protein